MNLDNLDKSKRYLLACSYGPDSMALFHLLLENRFDFDVAHVNYGLREEAEKETEGLIGFCEKHHITLYIQRAEVNKRKNMESECREIRYRFFKDLCEQNHYEGVLVAHNEDDLIETYFMQLKRVIRPKYYGIAEKTMILGINIIRPLLSYSKKSLQELCDTNGVPYAIDSSNLTDSHDRNIIRHHIVEPMGVEERIKTHEIIDKANKELEEKFRYLDSVDIHDIKTILSMDYITYLYALNTMASEIRQDIAISKYQALEIEKMLKSNKPNIVFKVSSKINFVKEYDKVRFESPNKEMMKYAFEVKSREVLDNEFFYLNLNTDTSNLNIRDDGFPITIRTAKPEDIVNIKDYQKEVRRLFIDWKMPMSLRKRWPVILDRSGSIIYIPRYQKDFKIDGKRNFYVKTK